MPVRITVGIVARNEATHIGETLRALCALDYPRERFEVVLVDGNSSDATPDIAREVLSGAGVAHRVVREGDFGGRGLCFARNLVIDQGDPGADYIAFIDADCIADPGWLSALEEAMDAAAPDVAGAGGARRIAPTDDVKERVINTFLTSRLGSGFNAVFSNQPVEYVRSIANYNAMYRREILSRFRYDESLVVSDDNEVNYRIVQAGHRFRFVREAVILHRETNSVREFARNMFSYGANIANSMRKHRTLMRPFVPLSLGLLGYLALLPAGVVWLGPIALVPLGLYGLLNLAAVLEVWWAVRTPAALWVLALFPLTHLCYAAGVLTNLLSGKVLQRG